MSFDRIAVLGAGAWGTALANRRPRRTRVTLWARDPRWPRRSTTTRKARACPASLDERVPRPAHRGRRAADAILLVVPAQDAARRRDGARAASRTAYR